MFVIAFNVERPAFLQEAARVAARLATVVLFESATAEPADGDQPAIQEAAVAVLKPLREVGAEFPGDLEQGRERILGLRREVVGTDAVAEEQEQEQEIGGMADRNGCSARRIRAVSALNR
ncbi:MAG: hypothetical protein AB7U20_11655 [Planctomycetaceae bacterium]